MQKLKSILMNEDGIRRSIARISHEIIEKNQGTDNLCIIGIQRRGVPIAERICKNILSYENASIPIGKIDITFYRDDLSKISELPVTHSTEIPFDINGKKLIITDDVLYTGRTIRAAIDGIFKIGRPACIQFAVLIDRGHRELPVRADYVGKNIPTSRTEMIAVNLPEYDNKCNVELYE